MSSCTHREAFLFMCVIAWLILTVSAERLNTFYLVNIGLPTFLMVIIAFSTIALPSGSESKLNIGITIFLSQVSSFILFSNIFGNS